MFIACKNTTILGNLQIIFQILSLLPGRLLHYGLPPRRRIEDEKRAEGATSTSPGQRPGYRQNTEFAL